MGSWGGEDSQQGGGWQTQRGGGLWNGAGQARLQLAHPTKWWLADPVAPHLHRDKPRFISGTAGERSRLCTPGLQCGEIKPQTSD